MSFRDAKAIQTYFLNEMSALKRLALENLEYILNLEVE